MTTDVLNESFRNVLQYPPHLLRYDDEGVQVPVTYKRLWQDGFGARGWKLDASIGDPEIIASTRETGQQINTSVFVHDILDHFLSGFGISGHRSEAMALIQLSKRTGSNPGSDYEQLVREDIVNGRVNGESLENFLPADLADMIPADAAMPVRHKMAYLRDRLGENELVHALVDQFFTLGRAGEFHAEQNWERLGLDSERRTVIGQALQSLLEVIDRAVEDTGTDELHGVITINNHSVVFTVAKGEHFEPIDGYRVEVGD